jgi:CRISPR-associated endonuclease/helicase Cas3
MVTELAPISSLVQRAGRLDRLGIFGQSRLVIAIPPQDVLEATDTVYSMTFAAVATFLKTAAAQENGLDFGNHHFPKIPPETLLELEPPPGIAPTLRPADVDVLCQTSPRPYPDVDVAPFLHGALEPDRDVSLVWRLDVPSLVPETAEELDPGLAEVLALVPPTSREALQIPIWAARAWLEGKARGALDVSDVEGVSSGGTPRRGKSQATAIRWQAGGELGIVAVSELRPGDVILLSTSAGGCDRFGWDPTSRKPVVDLSQELAAERRPLVRITAAETDLKDTGACTEVRAQLADAAHELELDPDMTAGDFEPAVAALRTTIPNLFTEEELGEEPILLPYAPAQPAHGFALVRRSLLPRALAEPFFSDDDEDVSIATAEISLDAHSTGVRDFAQVFVEGVHKELAEDLVYAAYQHDIGKAEPRMQAFLNGGRPRPPGAARLAKGVYELRSPRAADRARKLSQFRSGLRHEAWSVAILDEVGRSRNEHLPVHDLELCRWLVGSHHGRGRPWFAYVNDPDAIEFRTSLIGDSYEATVSGDQHFSHLDAGWVATFWSVMRRYGWWATAYLEAVLRLADHRRSEFEMLAQGQKGKRKRG